ncbi:MAG TPA: hypothetical protein PK830_06285 [Candidatus Atribacteria bacterium]|nr:hypothetical protein [Candidatus Atribacteria bacterium]HPT78692.1 hypothetical protein [Candidatus Atribacteria bacterium]
MRLVKLLVIILMITALGAASYFIISAKNKAHAYDLVQISTARPISFGEDQDIHFFSEGFIITGPQARFYNYSGNEMSKPFTHDDLLYENGEINIALHTENYLITKSGHIYSTASVPFKRIYDNPEGLVIAGAQEGADFLLLLLARDEYNVEPYILVNGSTFLLSLDGRGNTKYAASAVSKGAKSLSVLSYSLDTPVPATRVFQYRNRNELYGVITENDQLLYDIYRQEDSIILIGTDSIICYNIYGDRLWTVDNTYRSSYEYVYTRDSLLLYFKDSLSSGSQGGNAVLINNDGQYNLLELPARVNSLIAHGRGFAGVEYGNTLVIMDENGRIQENYRMTKQVVDLYKSPYMEDMFFAKTVDNTLAIYSYERKDERSERN